MDIIFFCIFVNVYCESRNQISMTLIIGYLRVETYLIVPPDNIVDNFFTVGKHEYKAKINTGD